MNEATFHHDYEQSDILHVELNKDSHQQIQK